MTDLQRDIAPAGPSYLRAQVRAGRLPISTRLFQGIGALPDTWKQFAFNTFLLFYYNQVLGLPPSLASLAIMIALVVDAISDPLVGSLSDSYRSSLGRRHPFMYGAALPLGLCLYLLFAPPQGIGHTGLFLWLLAFTVCARTAMTFFVVPWNALFAEFSDDYVDRTAIVTWRYAIGWLGGVVFAFLSWSLVFPSSEAFTPGHLNPDAYPRFAMVLGSAVALAALLTTHLTRREIPFLLQPAAATRFSIGTVLQEVRLALGNRSFNRVFLAILLGGAISGAGSAMTIYMQTYFWGLTPEDLRWFVIAVFGAVLAFGSIVPLQHRFDKKHILLGALTLGVIDGIAVVGLRLLDLLPPNGEPLLLGILLANSTFTAGLATIAGIIGASMIADTLDEQEYATGLRQEGIFSSALSFSAKMTTGVGLFAGGLILEFGLGLAPGTRPEDLATGTLLRLGLIAGLLIPVLNVLPIVILRRYELTRARHAELRAALNSRHVAAADAADTARAGSSRPAGSPRPAG